MSEPRVNLSTTPRLYVAQSLFSGASIGLSVPQSHYLAQVMRRQPGDRVRLFDGTNGEWAARLVSVGRKAVIALVETQTGPQEITADLWLCAAPLKRDRFDWVAEKACELGVSRLVPVVTQRTNMGKLNLDKLRVHMTEAAEQCGRTAIPEVTEPVSLAELLRNWPAERALLFADEAGGEAILTGCARAPAPAGALIGPEGGFTDGERAAIRGVSGAIAVSLGPRILRADTAAAVAVGVWQAVMGR